MPNLQECWYDNDGNMIHYQHPLYPNHISRAEAMELTGDDMVSKKKPAKELIENINAAETAEAATAAAEADTRKTVVDALEAKLKTFETN